MSAYHKISVLIPTRHRVHRLETLLASFRRTVDEESKAVELIFKVDDDDIATIEFLKKLVLPQESWQLVTPRGGGYRDMPVFFNDMLSVATGDVFLCGNDDMVFQTVDWPEQILEVANAHPDGLFNIGVSTHNAGHWPFSIVSRKAVECLGFIWDPQIFWGDIFLRDVMAFFGRAIMLPSVTIDHDWAGYQPDKVFVETRDSKSEVEGNPQYWIDVHRPAVIQAIERLKELRA